MKFIQKISTISIVWLLIMVFYAQAKEINFDREQARKYASEHCGTGTPPDTGYNTNPNNDEAYKDFSPRDCANFASQALIQGGIKFDDLKSATPIGIGKKNKGEKGFPGVKKLLSALGTSACFEAITDPAEMQKKAQPGDVLSSKSSSHVVIYAGNDKYYGHTTDRCNSTGYDPPESLWNDVILYHFRDGDKCQKCVRDDWSKIASMEPKCDGCSTCDSATGACNSSCGSGGLGRCASTKSCKSFGGLSLCVDFGPGGDCPDDTATLGTSTPSSNEAVYPSTSSPVGVLDNGYPYDMLKVMSRFGQDARLVPIDGLDPNLSSTMPLFIIPSAGLMGLSDSEFFKASLNEYVRRGGTVLVLAQQYGYEFSAIPGGLTGYGWQEDQSCQQSSSYIDTWHNVLAGQTNVTPSLNIDGYFTKYPDNTTVLLRRTANGQPALITYPYENGRIIATSAFTDYAYTSNQASADEIRLLRDIITLAVKHDTLPEIKPGQTATANITVTNNNATETATAVEVEIYDPDRKERKFYDSISINLAPGQSTQIPVTYTTTATDPVGIYHIKYNLMAEGYQLLTSELDPEGTNVWLPYQLQIPREEPTGRFVVSSPPSNPFKSPDFNFAINTDFEQYAYGSDAVFMITIWNNTDTYRTIAARCGTFHLNVSCSETITLPAHLSASFQAVATNVTWQGWLIVYFSDETGKSVGAAQKGIWMFQPSVNVNAKTDKAAYAKGETVNLTLNLQNKQAASYTANLRVRVADPLNSDIYINTIPVTLVANGTLTQSLSFVLPLIPNLGFYTASAEIYDATGRKIGGNSASFEVPKSQIAVMPNLPSVFSTGANTIPFTINNTGKIGISSGNLDVSLKDPDGTIVYSGAQPFALAVGQTTTIDIPVSIPSLKFGNYTLTYAQSDETRIGGMATHTIPNTVTIKLVLDKPSYSVREAAGLTVDLTNTGKFNLDTLALSVSVIEAGYADNKTILLSTGSTSQFTYLIPIPATVLPGQHDVNVTLTLPSGRLIVQTAKLSVPESNLFVTGAETTQFAAGDIISLTIENTGGVDTSYTTEKLAITDNKGVAIYQGSITGTIMAGEKKTFTDIQVPLQAVNGAASLDVRIKNGRTLMLSSLNKSIDISGLTATLQTKTVKDLYIKTEEIASLSSISNGQYGIDGGSLKIAVSRIKSTGTGQFTHFLPKEGWGYMQEPSGVAIAPDGSVYVADTNNSRIQKFDSRSNLIMTLGSSCIADFNNDGVPENPCIGQFHGPKGIAVGSGGSIYVADSNNHRIQKFDGNGNFMMTWGSYCRTDTNNAGSADQPCNGLFASPSGIAIDSNDYVYVVDYDNNRIQKFDNNGNFIAKWGSWGVGNGQFWYPNGIAVTSNGFVYVADTGINRIQKFDSNGTFIAKWGSRGYGDGQFVNPYGIGIDSGGSVYVADTDNSRIQKFDSNGNFITKWGGRQGSGMGEFGMPKGIAAGHDGSIYVADTGNARIQKFNSDGGFITKWGNSYCMTDTNFDRLPDKPCIGEFYYPYGIAIGSDGSVYVADTSNHRIQMFDNNGAFIAQWGSQGNGDGQFNAPTGMAVASDGSVYVVDRGNNRIQKFDRNGNFILKWGGRGNFEGAFFIPFSIAIAPDGFIYVADPGNRRIQKFDSNGNFITRWGWYQWQGPYGVAVAPDGLVYVTDWNHRVYKFGSNGGHIREWGGYCISDSNQDGVTDQPCDGKFYYPLGIAVAADNSVYVADTYNNRIQMFDSNGSFIAKWGSYGRDGNGKFNIPYYISISPDGSVYVADTYNHRVQRMILQIAGSDTLFETTVPITQSANATQDYATNIGTLNATGKLYLQAELKNTIGQTIATAEYPFYIIEGNTVLLFNTDKKYYKPSETVTITGEVKNLAGVNLDNAVLLLNTGTTTLINQTISVPAGGSYPFTFTTTAGSEGIVSLTGKVTHNNSILIEITDQYEVANPKVSATVSAPNAAGNEPFNINIEIKNQGKVVAVVSLHSSVDGQMQSMTIPAGETKLIQYSQQITNNTTYVFAFTGDFNQTMTTTVLYGLSASIVINPSTVYPEGKVAIPVTITNTGQLDETITVDFRLQTQDSSQTKNYYLPKGTSITDTLYYDLAKGSYQLSAVSSQPSATAQVSFKVLKENDLSMTATIGVQTNGLIPVTVDITNNGYNTVEGSVQLSVVSGQTAVWSGEQTINPPIPPLGKGGEGGIASLTFTINPASITPGDYTLRAELLNNSNQLLTAHSLLFTVHGPQFQITQLPTYSTFTAGAEGSFTFTVKNTGNLEGEMNFSLKAMDVLDQTRVEWLKPGEEKTLTFNFLLPEDIEEKDYFAEYALKWSVASDQWSENKGQVKYHVAGINLSVNASLDKQNYNVGETAHLTIVVSDQWPVVSNINLFARVNYAGYEANQPFTLNGSQTLAFDIPLAEITGEKLFYGIYHESGRSIHLNSLYIYKAGDAITIATDKQVYNPGETVSVSVNSVSGATGIMILSGPGNYSETFEFSGSATKSFALSSMMTAGTYYISYQLTVNSSQLTGTHPIDVNGIQVKVKEATLDKTKYAAMDSIALSLTIESNQDLSATLKTWVVDPDGNYTKTGEQGVSLSSSEPLLFTGHWSLTTALMGIHRLVYGIYSGDMLLSSGSEAFDVGDAVLMGAATDKVDYLTNTESVSVTVSAFGTVTAGLEFFLDGTSIKTDSMNLAGFTSYTFVLSPSSVSPGSHTLKAVLTTGGLNSTKETSFVYGSSLPDLVVTVSSRQEAVGSKMQIIATVLNQGKTPSSATTASLYDGDPAAGGSKVTSLTVPALEPGMSAALTYDWNVLGKAGAHTIYGVVDSTNAVIEFNESNNIGTTQITLPDIILNASTAELEYKANADVGMVFHIANLTSDRTYENVSLNITLLNPQGNIIMNRSQGWTFLYPATEATYAMNWNTQTNAPGDYTVREKLLEAVNILTEGSALFTILPTPSIIGTMSMSKDTVIQGFGLDINYTLTNNGNINLSGGEAKIEFIPTGSQIASASFTQAFGSIAVFASLSQTLNIQNVEVDPGDYTVRLTANAEGVSFIIGEKPLKVLPPLEVTKQASMLPRVLVLLDEKEDKNDDNGHGSGVVDLNRTIITDALNTPGAYYTIITDKKQFKQQMRSGLYNLYILTGKEPFEDHIDEELVERVNSGDGLILLNYEKIEDKKFREAVGAKSEGHLSDKQRTLTIIENPMTALGTFSITGKVEKLENISPNVIIVATIEEKGKTYIGILINPYGKGRVITFTFDMAQSAKDSGDTASYSSLLMDAVAYTAPKEIEPVPGTPFGIEIKLKSFGAAFDLKVEEKLSAELPILLTYPAAVIDGQTVKWEFKLQANETESLLYLIKLPEDGGTYTPTTEVSYLKNGSYESYNTYSLTIGADGLHDIQMRIFSGLEAINEREAEEISEDYQELLNKITPNMEKKDIEKAIHDLIDIIEEIGELKADTKDIRLDLDKLIRALERRWVDAGGK